MSKGRLCNTLFLCTGNAAYSIRAEVLVEHWGMPDPAAVDGSQTGQRRAFRDASGILESRIKLFTAPPLDRLDHLEITRQADEIGRRQPEKG